MPVIEVSNLTKAFRTYKKQPGFSGAIKGLFHRQYEQTVAVNEVSFKIEPGELVGFLGPNGAGKTTTLKMLAGRFIRRAARRKSSATRRGNATTAIAGNSRSCSARKTSFGGICPRANRWN